MSETEQQIKWPSTTNDHRHYRTPMNIHRPRNNEQSMQTKIAIAQTNSTQHRKVKITLPTPDWEKDAANAGKDRT